MQRLKEKDSFNKDVFCVCSDLLANFSSLRERYSRQPRKPHSSKAAEWTAECGFSPADFRAEFMPKGFRNKTKHLCRRSVASASREDFFMAFPVFRFVFKFSTNANGLSRNGTLL